MFCSDFLNSADKRCTKEYKLPVTYWMFEPEASSFARSSSSRLRFSASFLALASSSIIRLSRERKPSLSSTSSKASVTSASSDKRTFGFSFKVVIMSTRQPKHSCHSFAGMYFTVLSTESNMAAARAVFTLSMTIGVVALLARILRLSMTALRSVPRLPRMATSSFNFFMIKSGVYTLPASIVAFFWPTGAAAASSTDLSFFSALLPAGFC
mmetsp:Transcript_8617/g.12843  ORF Transcript_8617/g.12843 Transcript_8617/m.12843 type:complete len:211 (+) Transcript_8617:1745-2377(+)